MAVNKANINLEEEIKTHRQEIVQDVSRFLKDIGLGGLFRRNKPVQVVDSSTNIEESSVDK